MDHINKIIILQHADHCGVNKYDNFIHYYRSPPPFKREDRFYSRVEYFKNHVYSFPPCCDFIKSKKSAVIF